MKKWTWVAPLLAATTLLAGCGGGEKQSEADTTPHFDAAFLMNNDLWREERKNELLAADGWTSLVGLHWLELKAHYIGSGSTSGIRLAMGPERMGMVSRDGDRLWFTPEPGAVLQVHGQPVNGRIAFLSDDADEPTIINFDDGKGALSLIHRGPRYALRVKHADAPARVNFTGLDYWPADPAWRITARYVPHDAGKSLPIADITGLVREQANAGAVEFERNGRTWRLEALGEPGRPLQLIFADRTSGRGSYAAGRYIDVGVPDDKSQVVVDFNRAYNPYCYYNASYDCPFPPKENRLPIAVRAGERTR